MTRHLSISNSDPSLLAGEAEVGRTFHNVLISGVSVSQEGIVPVVLRP